MAVAVAIVVAAAVDDEVESIACVFGCIVSRVDLLF